MYNIYIYIYNQLKRKNEKAMNIPYIQAKNDC